MSVENTAMPAGCNGVYCYIVKVPNRRTWYSDEDLVVRDAQYAPVKVAVPTPPQDTLILVAHLKRAKLWVSTANVRSTVCIVYTPCTLYTSLMVRWPSIIFPFFIIRSFTIGENDTFLATLVVYGVVVGDANTPTIRIKMHITMYHIWSQRLVT
jgi:hypothetical protein